MAGAEKLNMGHKGTMLKCFKDMIAEIEIKGGDQEKLEKIKALYKNIESATNETELKKAIKEFVEKSGEMEIKTDKTGFKIITKLQDRELVRTDFIDSLPQLARVYAENFIEHVLNFDVVGGVAVGGNLLGEELERTLMLKDGENIIPLDKLLDTFTEIFKRAVTKQMTDSANKQMDKLREQSNNLKI